MSKYELSLCPDYVSSWDIYDAIRELLQNAIDQETQQEDNEMFCRYNDETHELEIGNKSSILDVTSLLLGSTSKADDNRTIGRFGEGYKLALLVLIRNGKPVKIYNYGAREIWTARFVKSRRYKDTNVLTVFTEKVNFWKTVPDNNLTIRISDISPEEYEVVVDRALQLQQYIGDTHETTRGQILLSEGHKGRVYVNGLYVCNLDLQYGYNFKPEILQLDRDRKMVRHFDIQWETSTMWRQVSNEETLALVKEGKNDVKFVASTTSDYRKEMELAKKAYDDFKNEYGERAIPVTNQYENQRIKEEYPAAVPVIVPEPHKQILERCDELATIKETLKRPSVKQRLLLWGETIKDAISDASYEQFLELIDELQ